MEKKIIWFQTHLLLVYFALFAFGQLPGWFVAQKLNLPFFLHPADAVVMLIAISWLPNLRLASGSLRISVLFIFTFLLAIPYFSDLAIIGLAYLLRLGGYILFAEAVSQLVHKKYVNTSTLLNSLLIAAGFIAAFGWIQYIHFYDLRTLKLTGWDDHLFRLVGTFLDPAFTGIMLVLGTVVAVFVNRRWSGIAAAFLTLTLAFTFSRASFLVFVLAHLYLVIVLRKKLSVFAIVLLLVCIPLLPKPFGEGVNLGRTNSITQKLDNTSEALFLFSQYPLFGVGFNNVCVAKQVINLSTKGHSCSGFDNSYLFLLSTVGVIGVFILADEFWDRVSVVNKYPSKHLLFASAIAVGVHGLFTNTLFYPFVLGWMGVIAAISFRGRTLR